MVARYLEDSSAYKCDGTGPSVRYRRFTDYIPANEVVKRLLKKRLDVLEQHAVGFLSTSGKASLKRICHESFACEPVADDGAAVEETTPS